jgi:hypothetical protein
MVFLLALKWPCVLGDEGLGAGAGTSIQEQGQIPRPVVVAAVLLWGIAVFLFGAQIIRSGIRYEYDWGYFLNRISVHTEFGRKLYSEMEFAYGPLLADFPVWVRAILSPLHVSAVGAYLVTLVLEVMGGLWLVAYVIDNLPMSRRWKAVIFLIVAAGMLVGNMGPNYTFIRFGPQLIFLVRAWKCRREWEAALWIFAGQALCLGVSPEIGFAFFVGILVFALHRFFEGRKWALTAAASLLSTAVFLVVEGWPYLHRVAISAHGIYSFPVEPGPFLLVFLFALVWLVPVCLAEFCKQRRVEAPMLTALYAMSLALLPAGFGRADPGHIYWNGTSVLLLSAVAISSKRRWQQIAWGGSLAVVTLWMCAINWELNSFEMKPVLHAEIAGLRDLVKGRGLTVRHSDDNGFSMQGLQAIVGDDPVATPDEVPLPVEKSLRASRQYTPSFYNFWFNLFDRDAEDRQISEFNQSKWALIPANETYGYVERPEDMKHVLGIDLPYRTRRPVYAVGLRFEKNLEDNWQVHGKVGDYLIYERR